MKIKIFKNISLWDYVLILKYNKKPTEFVDERTLSTNKKVRTIITYSNNRNGLILRTVHQKIKEELDKCFESSDLSYAYKKDCNVKTCVNKHLNSKYFLKFDLKNFFDSINFDYFCYIFYLLTEKKKKYLDLDRLFLIDLNYQKFLKVNKRTINILKCCFYNGCLPLGLVTSPKISDLYLFLIDQKYIELSDTANIGKICLTRYCDDLLLSTPDERKVRIMRHYFQLLKADFDTFGLTINNNKTKELVLENENEGFKFLGLVIQRCNGKNRIMISNNYLKKVCKDFSNHQKYSKGRYYLTDVARIIYIKNISEESYQKFIKLYRIKNNEEFVMPLVNFSNWQE